MSGKKTTTKRQVSVGQETYVNSRTGEVTEFHVMEVEDRDFNFDKIWVFWLAQTLDLIGNSKVQVLTYLFEKRDRNNRVIATQRVMAEEIGVSLSTVSITLTALQEIGAISSPQNGVYMVNPEFIYRGNHSSRMRVLLDYKKTQAEEEETEISAAAE